jgi:hypothetical protein
MLRIASQGAGWWIPEGWGPYIFFGSLACVLVIILYFRKSRR